MRRTNITDRRLRRIEQKVDWVLHKLDLILELELIIMPTLDEILVDVTAEEGKIDSLSVLITGLRQQVMDALSGATLSPAVQAKVDAVFSQAEKNKGKIDAALAAPGE